MHSPQRGFFLIEVIVASSIITVVLILLVGSIQNTVEVSQRALERTQASFLLEEGAEATKAIRDTSWNSISTLNPGTSYYLSYNGTAWVFTTTPNTIDRFTRTVVISNVSRDSADDISASGTNDADTKLVTVTVSWTASTGVQTRALALYITNIRE